MEKEKVIETLEKYYEALDERDIEKALSLFHEDIIFKHPKFWNFEREKAEYHGKDEFKHYLENRGRGNLTHEVREIIAGEDKAVVIVLVDMPDIEESDVDYFLDKDDLQDNKMTAFVLFKFKENKIYRYFYGTCSGFINFE